MATPKKRKHDDNEGYRKPARMARVKGRLASQLEKLVTRNDSDFTEEVNRAVREMLEREKLWPMNGASGSEA